MANSEDGVWRTIHGTPVFIRNGESVNDAINRQMRRRQQQANQNENTKNTQIARNRAEADKRNKQNTPPKQLPLPDITAEQANKFSDVLNLRTKERYRFKSGTKITHVYSFAGKDCKNEFRDREKYARRYRRDNDNPEEWQHCAGRAIITNGTQTLEREVHWVQGKQGKVREAFIKERENNLRDSR